MKKSRKRTLLVAVALAGAVVAVLLFTRAEADDALVAAGTVEGTEALVGFRTAGTVAELLVREGDEVAAGQVLAVIDTATLHARRLQMQAQVGTARAVLRELESGSRPQEIAQASSAHQAATVQLQEARRNYERARVLYEGGVVSRQAYDDAATALAVHEQKTRQAREQADLVREGPRRERIDAQRAQLQQAEGLLAEVEAAVADAIVRAPFAGVVTVRHREPGEIVAPGAPAVSVLDRSDRWVRVYIPETRLAAVRLGAAASITSDTYENRKYAGRVSFIASEAEFTPRSVQTQEERVKLVYAARVRITDDPRYDLKPGMPADVLVALPRERGRDE